MNNVKIIYDTTSFTWNVMSGLECLFYGSADECDRWLENNQRDYVEVEQVK